MVYKYGRALRAMLFPGCCRLCGASARSGPALCRACHADLPWLLNACPCCARPLHTADTVALCGRCQRRPPAFDAVVAPLHYLPPVDHLIRRFKFAEELATGSLLAGLLADRLATRKGRLPGLLLPVPLHPSRLRSRGFNQATEIARHVGSRLGIRVDHRACRRSRDTLAQSLLSPTARRLNLRGAFAVPRPPRARHVAIIDDVMTTGYTANELARSLKAAGVASVEVWVVARAGGPGAGAG